MLTKSPYLPHWRIVPNCRLLYSFLKIHSTPYNFPYAGHVLNGSLDYVGSYGNYWSRTAKSGTVAYDLFFSSSNVGPAYNDYRYNGFPVRCVATT